MSRTACCLLLCAGLAAADGAASGDEPTAEETMILELMNRFRADPVGEADRLLEIRGEHYAPDDVDWAMFEREVKALQPAPPLVFDLDALRAARRHSLYMIDHGLTHDEEPGKSHFVARKFAERMKMAGFTGSPGGENCFRDARSALNSQFAFIVDFGKGGPGGMQPGRGHRMNMINARFDVVGPSAVPHGGAFSVTHNFGVRPERFAGGVVYVDRNRNGSYDIGEGRGGATVRTGDGSARCVTWASGAYSLVVGSGAGGLVAEWNGLSHAQAMPAGADNVKFDWAIPAQADLELADRLIADARAATGRKARAATVALLLRSAGLGLDADRRSAIDALTADVAGEFAALQQPVLAALDAGDAKAFKAAVREGGKAFRGTLAADWFAQAELLAQATAGVAGLEAAVGTGPVDPAQRAQLREHLVAAAASVSFPDLKAAFAALVARADAAR